MRNYFIAISLLFTVVFPSCAQKKKDNRVSEKDTASSLFIPEPLGRVSDYEQLFTVSQTKYLDSILQTHESETGNQIAIVSFSPDSSIQSTDDFKRFSLSLFRKWGVGQKEKDNGIGILISAKIRKVRIEVGYGLESKLTDEKAKAIIDSIIIPRFKNADYFGGVSSAVSAIISIIK